MDDIDNDIPSVHPELIDNDDIFSPKLWETLVVPIAALILYLLEAPMLWWVIALGSAGLWILQNCVRRLAFRDALHTQTLDRRIQKLERQVANLQAGVDVLHRREAMRERT
ncbi:hypothetical protein IVB02_17475 [Bradyrhizobium sp. 166]|uniref:hypothetical protein n=1 Tax=Bradyrhizobium sp. 166 TaxID=2782638 RepID=UPI001FFA135A|nr:hypothetical protein [Bradyrhizobium sp. 166]MCK1603188.1 hypothetical protein [Bradyrhizobium sp. 166]